MRFFVDFCWLFRLCFLFWLADHWTVSSFRYFWYFPRIEIYNQCSEDILDDFLPLSFLADHRCSWSNFGVNNTHISGFDYRVTCTAGRLAIPCFESKITVSCSPIILQLLFSSISLLRCFLIISFLAVISDLRNSISFSRIVIYFFIYHSLIFFLIVQIDFLFYLIL